VAGEIAKGFLDIEVNIGDSVRTIRQLTTEVNAFQLSLNSANQTQADFAKKYTNAIKNVANDTGVLNAQIVKIASSASILDKTLSKGQATLGQFFSAKFNKNGAIAAEVMGLARERVSALSSSVIATTKSINGMQEVLKVNLLPEFSNASDVAAQKQQILSTMLKQGTTNLINFGKNVQWAGRQLMVGFTVPLTIFGNVAGKTFMDLEKQVVAFKKVYGDLFTTPAELENNLQAVTNLASEYTKYGVAVKDTIGLAAQAAAAGRQNADLTDAVAQATRLATLGQMEQNEALETTISLQSAFKLSGKDLADTINFLNMVENQTVVSLQDLAAAIPRVAPVVQGLGGDVKDLAVFLAAMQEGGVDAAEGANALKSGLASLINPTKQATQMLAGMGINLQAIIEANKGDLMGTVMAFSQALANLDQFSRQQALEQVFGKFQYAKLGALFENISRQGSQAQQVIATMGYTTEQLGATADKELKAIEESFGVQLTGAIERFKLAIAPIGELFVKNAIPIINMFTKIAEGFNNLSDGKKQFITIATAIVGIVIPAGTMLLGLLMNLTGTLTKFVTGFASFAKSILTGNIKKAFQDLGGGSKYLSLAEIDAAVAAERLSQASQAVSASFQKQILETDILAAAVNRLAAAFGGLSLAQMEAASNNPNLYVSAAGASSAARGIKTGGRGFRGVRRNSGGPIVPGVGNTDSVPALLTPGEFVVNKQATRENYSLLEQINSGGMPGFNKGGKIPGVQYFSAFNIMRLVRSRKAMLGSAPAPRVRVDAMDLNVSQQASAMGRAAFPFTNGEHAWGLALEPVKSKTAASGMDLSHIALGERVLEKLRKLGAYIDPKYTSVQTPGFEGLAIAAPSNLNRLIGSSILRSAKTEKKRAFNQETIDIINRRYGGFDSNSEFMRAIEAGVPITPKEFEMFYVAVSGLKNQGVTVRNALKELEYMAGGNLLNPSAARLRQIALDGVPEGSIFTEFMKDAVKTSKSSHELSELLADRVAEAIYSQQISGYGLMPGSAKNVGSLGAKQAIRNRKLAEIEQFRIPFNKGGKVWSPQGPTVPGMGNTDSVPAMLTPGEFVVNKDATQRNIDLLHQINSGKVSGYKNGGMVSGVQKFAVGGLVASIAIPLLLQMLGPKMLQKAGVENEMAYQAMNILPFLIGFGGLGKGLLKGAVSKGAGQGGKMLDIKGVLTTLVGTLKNAITPLRLFAVVGTATVAGLISLQKSVKQAQESGAKLSEAMYGSADTVKSIGEAFGRESFAQQERRAAAEAAGGQQITEEAVQQSSQFMSTDAGKQLLDQMNMVRNAGQDVVTALRNQLTAAIVAGVITTEEARAIALDVAKAMGDEKIGIEFSGQLTELVGPNGEKIEGNLPQIIAEITPKINTDQIVKDAEKAWDDLSLLEKWFAKWDEEGWSAQSKVLKVSEEYLSSLTKQADARALLNYQLQQGLITQEEYNSQIIELDKLVTQTNDSYLKAQAEVLGFENVDQLVARAEEFQKQVESRGRKTAENRDPVGAEALKALEQTGETLKQTLIDSGYKEEIADQIINGVKDGLADGDAIKAGEIFAKMLSGQLSTNAAQILINLDYRGNLSQEQLAKLTPMVQELSKIPDIDTLINFSTAGEEQITKLYEDYQNLANMDNIEKNAYIKENFSDANLEKLGIDYQKIIDMPDSVTKVVVMAKVNAIIDLQAQWENFKGLTGEDSRTRAEITNKMKDLSNSVNLGIDNAFNLGDGLNEQGGGGGGSKTDWKKNLQNRFDLVEKRLSLEAQAYQQNIRELERKNELERRSIEVNNRALTQLSKQEDLINDSYEKRINLLDEVANTNDRLRQQEQSRIGLATALASGDIASAAAQMAEITSQNTAFRIEDARAALEVQKEQDIKNLKIEINGELLSREEIEARIDSIEESIYQRNLLIRDAQDSIYNIEEKRLANSREREKVETRMYLLEQQRAITELKRMAAGRKGGKLTGEERSALESFKTSYNQMAAFYNQTFGDSIPQMNAFGGKIKKMAFGGMMYKGSNEMPPPLKMAFGNIVPGLGNTDRVPALLTPGEFVVRKSVARANMPLLEMLNNGITGPSYNVPSSDFGPSKPSVQQNTGIVYNDTYSINVNVSGTNASPDEIANAVLSRLSQFNSGNVRGIRY